MRRDKLDIRATGPTIKAITMTASRNPGVCKLQAKAHTVRHQMTQTIQKLKNIQFVKLIVGRWGLPAHVATINSTTMGTLANSALMPNNCQP